MATVKFLGELTGLGRWEIQDLVVKTFSIIRLLDIDNYCELIIRDGIITYLNIYGNESNLIGIIPLAKYTIPNLFKIEDIPPEFIRKMNIKWI